jgi:hypothetical protein
MPALEELAELLHGAFDFAASFDSSIDMLTAGWDGFVGWLEAFWGVFTGFFQTLFI